MDNRAADSKKVGRVHLLISDQRPLSCSRSRISLALCEVTLSNVLHCNTLHFKKKIWHLSPREGAFSLHRQLVFFISSKWDTNTMSPFTGLLVQMLICTITDKEREHTHTRAQQCARAPTAAENAWSRFSILLFLCLVDIKQQHSSCLS